MRTVSDLGKLPDTLPIFFNSALDTPFNLRTLTIIFPYSMTLATVGLLETMMTTTVINGITHTAKQIAIKNAVAKGWQILLADLWAVWPVVP